MTWYSIAVYMLCRYIYEIMLIIFRIELPSPNAISTIFCRFQNILVYQQSYFINTFCLFFFCVWPFVFIAVACFFFACLKGYIDRSTNLRGSSDPRFANYFLASAPQNPVTLGERIFADFGSGPMGEVLGKCRNWTSIMI